MQELQNPEGIGRHHIHGTERTTLRKWPIGLLVLGALLLGSPLGLFGAGARQTVRGGGAILTIDAPTRVRTGQLYEMVLTVQAEDAIDEVVLHVAPQVWRGVTINTFIPAASEETVEEGSFAFRYGGLAKGERLIIKVDAQVNPDHAAAANEGRIAVLDGERELLAAPFRMEVLP